jgi:SH3-like domain-containing protein
MAVIWAAALTAARAEAKRMSVQVKQGAIRATPSFVGQVVQTLSYGDRVTVVEEKAGWARVTAGTVSGWMHQSALSAKRIVLAAGADDVRTGAASDELALAGKGFNSSVEAQFKQQNPRVDYGPVDRMEARTVSPAQIADFLKQGHVGAAQGGAR